MKSEVSDVWYEWSKWNTKLNITFIWTLQNEKIKKKRRKIFHIIVSTFIVLNWFKFMWKKHVYSLNSYNNTNT